jgi:hypothetical protein
VAATSVYVVRWGRVLVGGIRPEHTSFAPAEPSATASERRPATLGPDVARGRSTVPGGNPRRAVQAEGFESRY